MKGCFLRLPVAAAPEATCSSDAPGSGSFSPSDASPLEILQTRKTNILKEKKFYEVNVLFLVWSDENQQLAGSNYVYLSLGSRVLILL